MAWCAVKKRVCRVNGTSLPMRSISGMKPMSSIAVGFVDDEKLATRTAVTGRARSGRAGGPAWRSSTSTPRSNLASWSSNETPPMIKRHVELSGFSRIFRSVRRPVPRVHASARGSACAACVRARDPFQHCQHRQHEGSGFPCAGLRECRARRDASTWGWPGLELGSGFCSQPLF